MCGIAGIVNLQSDMSPPSRDSLSRMVSAIRHRGPDQAGIFRDRRAGLVAARLSIIDLEHGQQPLSNEDGTLWVVFNGEIFNYVELRAQLVQRGHTFRTSSDTEVIVHAWEEWGKDSLGMFNGQWSFAIWDSEKSELILSRDGMGILPLYYAEKGSRVVFASEVKALFAGDPSLRRGLDPLGLLQTFTFWSSLSPTTVFDGVSELPPGSYRIYRRGEVGEGRHWDWTFPVDGGGEFQGAESGGVEELEEELLRATSLRMLRSDVPVGCYLSGGLDSSLVTSLAIEAKEASCQTFSIRFEEDEFDEASFQQTLVKTLDVDHHEVRVSGRDICGVFPEVIRHAERPVLRTAPAPLFLLSRLARDAGVKVVLTGEGADEIFAGYDLFREGILRRRWAQEPDSDGLPELFSRLYPYLSRSPVSQRSMARQFFGQGLERWQEPGFAHSLRWKTTGALRKLFSRDLLLDLADQDTVGDFRAELPPSFSRWEYLAQDQYIEAVTLLPGYILSSQGDRMLMAHSVEGRFPFLDKQVVQLANSFPGDFKIRDMEEKRILRLIAAARVPASILERPKQPYRAPGAVSFVSEDRGEWVDEVLSPEEVRGAGIFNPELVSLLWEKCLSGTHSRPLSNTDDMALVGVASTQLLVREFFSYPSLTHPEMHFSVSVDRVDG